MQLRHYQTEAIEAILSRYSAGDQRTIIVMSTGCGKTIIFAHLAKMFHDNKLGRILVLTHRQELLEQACAKLKTITGIQPDVEKAEKFSTETGFDEHKNPIVVASVQSLISGKNGERRMHRFKPSEYGLVICDEVHHGISKSFSDCINYFCQNPKLKFLGVTATADRLDGEDLGQIFQSVAYEYQLDRAIADGYLVPIRQRRVYIDGLDFSLCKTTAGDVNQGDLEEAMMFEKPLHGVAYATIETACGLEKDSLRNIAEEPDAEKTFLEMVKNHPPKKTLVFCVTVAHAERMAEIFHRWIPDSSESISGDLPADERATRLKWFHDGDIAFLCGVGVPLEGFNEPGISLVSMCRPTKSRTVYTQAVGRGTRPSESIAHQLGECESSDDRRAMIAESEKSVCTVLDFVGNSGRHNLICTADILGVKYDEAVVDSARAAALAGDVDMSKALETAQEDFDKKKREAEAKRKKEAEDRSAAMAAEAARRVQLRGVATYEIEDVENPQYRSGPGVFETGNGLFKVDLGEAQDGGNKVTAKQLIFLRDKGKLNERNLKKITGMGRQAAGALQAAITRRFDNRDLPTGNQLMLCHSCGVPKAVYMGASFEQASAIIDKLTKNGWRYVL